MGIRENFQKMIDKKQQEVDSLETQIREARVYIQALQDSMKLLPKDGNGVTDQTLRPGTDIAKARDAIKKAGGAMHIDAILAAIGKPVDPQNRLSLNGTLSGYARKGKIFVRTASHTFSLIEFGPVAASTDEGDELKEAAGMK